MVYTARLKAVNPEGICKSDNRGTHQSKPNKTKEQDLIKIRKHIESFLHMKSHYCRKNTQKEYLPSDMSLAKMYHLFQAEYTEQNLVLPSFFVYRTILTTEYNLSFFSTKERSIDRIIALPSKTDEKLKLELKESYESHLRNKKLSREQKQTDKEKAQYNTEPCFLAACFD